jgi:prepilin-type N-terminal cleavage/methylation domain-containing protein
MHSFKKFNRGFTLIELRIVVAIVGVLAALAIYGVRKYLLNSKTAEVRNAVGQMAKDAKTSYERESMPSTILAAGAVAGVSNNLCSDASKSVRLARGALPGKSTSRLRPNGPPMSQLSAKGSLAYTFDERPAILHVRLQGHGRDRRHRQGPLQEVAKSEWGATPRRLPIHDGPSSGALRVLRTLRGSIAVRALANPRGLTRPAPWGR